MCGTFVGCQCLLKPAGDRQRVAAIDVGLRKTGVDLQRPFIGGQRFLGLSHRHQQVAEVEVDRGIGRVQGDRFVETATGSGQVAGILLRAGEVGVVLRREGRRGNRPFQMGDATNGIALQAGNDAEQVLRIGISGRIVQQPGADRRSRRQVAGPETFRGAFHFAACG